MEQTINISLEFFLMMLFGGVTLFITAPMAWILRASVRDQKELEKEFVGFKDEVNRDFVRKEDLNRRLDQVSSDIESIKNTQASIFALLSKKADR